MKNLLFVIFLLFPILAYGQTANWQYKSIESQETTMAGWVNVRVLINDGIGDSQTIFLQFKTPPNALAVVPLANMICERLNNPPPPPVQGTCPC